MNATKLGLLALTILIGAAASTSALAAPAISLVANDFNAVNPAINNSDQIIYGVGSQVFSAGGNLLASDAILFNLGIADSGEVVYETLSHEVTSTTRGVLGSGSAPSISPTTGEVCFTNAGYFYTTLQGLILPQPFGAGYSASWGDVNDHGEVVFELHNFAGVVSTIYSNTRGLISPFGVISLHPAINNLGEVVWAARDASNHEEIFSSTRGQLTFFGGASPFELATQPDINDRGDVVFHAFRPAGSRGIYLLSEVPEPASWLLLASGLAAVYTSRKAAMPTITALPTSSCSRGDCARLEIALCSVEF